jgi:hypothetical protein
MVLGGHRLLGKQLVFWWRCLLLLVLVAVQERLVFLRFAFSSSCWSSLFGLGFRMVFRKYSVSQVLISYMYS